MLQAISVGDAKNDIFDNSAQVLSSFPRHSEQEERIMDKADFAATSTQKRLTHEEIFGALRGKIHAG